MPALKLNEEQIKTLDKIAEYPGYRIAAVPVSKQVIENLGKSALEYMLNRGSSGKELLNMIRGDSLVRKAADAFANDKKSLLEEGFTKEQIDELGLDTGATRFSYDSSITNPNEFSLQLKKQMKQGYSVANDYQELEEIVNTKTNWADIGFKALKYGIIAGVIVGGVCIFLGGTSTAEGETYKLSWNHWSPTDFDYNFVVDYNDLGWLADHWLTPGDISTENYPGTDTNGDGIVNLRDFAVFANEFKLGKDARDNNARMKAYVAAITYEPGDSYYPGVAVEGHIYNISPQDNYYDMREVTFASGSNNGVNAFVPYDDWDKKTDANESRSWKTDGTYIGPGEVGLFTIYAVGDANHAEFKKDLVSALNADESLEFTPLIIDLPK